MSGVADCLERVRANERTEGGLALHRRYIFRRDCSGLVLTAEREECFFELLIFLANEASTAHHWRLSGCIRDREKRRTCSYVGRSVAVAPQVAGVHLAFFFVVLVAVLRALVARVAPVALLGAAEAREELAAILPARRRGR